jgi:hypothetical protein
MSVLSKKALSAWAAERSGRRAHTVAVRKTLIKATLFGTFLQGLRNSGGSTLSCKVEITDHIKTLISPITGQSSDMSSIDIAVPCYQYGRFLRDSVNSIRTQRVDNIRILIIDNASTDNSLEVAQEFAREDSRIEVIAHRSNLGHHASFNEAIDWAAADYFMLFDADDVLAPGSLAHSIAIMDRHPAIAFSHGVEHALSFAAGSPPEVAYDSEKGEWRVSSGSDFIQRVCSSSYNFVGATTVVRRTSAQKKAGYYIRNFNHAIDLNMWLRLAFLGDVAETTAVQSIRRLHRNQLTSAYLKDPARSFAELHANVRHFLMHEGAALAGVERTRWTFTKTMAASAVRASARLLSAGELQQSIALLKFVKKIWRSDNQRSDNHMFSGL